jgi:hypothetical protein
MFQGEERIKAERLGQIAQCHVLGEDGSIGVPVFGQDVERGANFHDPPPQDEWTANEANTHYKAHFAASPPSSRW